MKKEKQISTVYLVAQYLKTHTKCYIHKMKKECKGNNIPDRIFRLRNTYGWNIELIDEGVKNGVKVYHYRLIEKGETITKFRK